MADGADRGGGRVAPSRRRRRGRAPAWRAGPRAASARRGRQPRRGAVRRSGGAIGAASPPAPVECRAGASRIGREHVPQPGERRAARRRSPLSVVADPRPSRQDAAGGSPAWRRRRAGGRARVGFLPRRATSGSRRPHPCRRRAPAIGASRSPPAPRAPAQQRGRRCRATRARPGRITVSNSSPLACAASSPCTRGDAPASDVGEQPVERVDESPASRRTSPRRLVPAQQREEALGGVEIERLRRRDAGPPSASHAPRTRAASAPRPRSPKRRRSDRAEALAAAPARRRLNRRAIADARDAASSRPRIEPSPRPHQIGEHSPHHGARSTASAGEAVGGLHERVRERHEVAHRLPLGERIELDRRERDARRAQRGQDAHRGACARGPAWRCRSTPARAPPHAAPRRGAPRLRVGHEVERRRAFRRRSRATGRGGANATAPLHGSLRAASTPRKHAVHPVDQLRPASGNCARGRGTRTGTSPITPLALRLEEQAHLGVAKAIDRLHRIADREQRAAVALRPARREHARSERTARPTYPGIRRPAGDRLRGRAAAAGRSARRLRPARRSAASVSCGVVDASARGEHDAAAARRPRQDLEQRLDRRPCVVVVRGDGSCARRAAPRRGPARRAARRACASLARAALRRRRPSFGREAVAPVHRLANRLALHEQPIGERAPSRHASASGGGSPPCARNRRAMR